MAMSCAATNDITSRRPVLPYISTGLETPTADGNIATTRHTLPRHGRRTATLALTIALSRLHAGVGLTHTVT
jgi:hypothetical protein